MEGTGTKAKGFAISNIFNQSSVIYDEIGSYPNLIQSYITTKALNRVAYTFEDKSITTVELAQQKIGDGFEVCYVLEEEMVEENIDLPTIPTHKGTNTIEIDTEVKPSSLEIEYVKSNN